MSSKRANETMEVMVARIDERVEAMHSAMPKLAKKVDKHDRDILAAKVVAGVSLVLLAAKFPAIADAIGRMISP